MNGAAAWCAGRVSRRTDLGRHTSLAWRLLSAALWLHLLGDALQMVHEVVLHEKAYPTWGDAAYLSFYVVAFAGLIAFPSRDLPTLLARADLAMYEAKRAGGGGWRRFEDAEQAAADPVRPTA